MDALVAHAHDACVVQAQARFVVDHGKSQRPIASHRHVGRCAIWGGRPEHSGGGGVPLVGGVMLFDHCFMFEGGSVCSQSATANSGQIFEGLRCVHNCEPHLDFGRFMYEKGLQKTTSWLKIAELH